MRPGILVLGTLIFLICGALLYVQKPTATPANPGEVPQGVSTARYWILAGMVLGGAIMALALLLPKVKVDPKKSPMHEYAKTSAGQDDSGFDIF